MTDREIVRPTAWRLMLLAFMLWAAVFLIGYAAALIAPSHVATDILLIALTVASVPALLVIDRRSRLVPQRGMVRAALIIAGLAILFNGLAAIN